MPIGFGASPEKPKRRTEGLDTEAFMTALLNGSTGVDAIRAAGFSGTSEEAARIAYQLRNKKWIKEELRLRHDELMRRGDLVSDDTLEHELQAHAFGDYKPEHRLKALQTHLRIRGRFDKNNAQKPVTEAELLQRFKSFMLLASANLEAVPGLPAIPQVVEPELTDAQLEEEARQAAVQRARKDKK